MSDISNGPVSTLPGHASSPEDGVCYDCGAPSVIRIQGETDSFGCEYHELCTEHLAEHRKSQNEPYECMCDVCKTWAVQRLFPARNYDEGMCGPVYYHCESCREKKRERDRLECEEYERLHGR